VNRARLDIELLQQRYVAHRSHDLLRGELPAGLENGGRTQGFRNPPNLTIHGWFIMKWMSRMTRVSQLKTNLACGKRSPRTPAFTPDFRHIRRMPSIHSPD
jgi:hypothetical protein